ncbi:lipopolysaccharide assembly protein LapA domain-containing protein [Desulfobaculum bizertense]|uniref:Putative membrane protein n=1 Tax=Desulfobaculum bizertense DSM 18034 TaxID=1121442 RepID=A0A1T4W362_9BACT|nr:LapA family protein [Desulfobaculum bizertense]UIJ38895.1 LapA family protein [Desulfobaculum bizertense]SKA71151.1 putative membrane protein [Desulfobaculum bizertense DSM 18034]
MRYLKALVLLALFFLTMVLFAQNIEALAHPVELGLNMFGQDLFHIVQPVYFLLLFSFIIGGVICTLYFLFEKCRMGTELRRCRKQIKTLEKEVNSLRNLPLEDANFPVEQPAAEASQDAQDNK